MVYVTHATTSFSLAYGLCYGSNHTDKQLEKFVKRQDAISPAGVIHLTIAADGSCLGVDQTNNVAPGMAQGKGRTPSFKCEFQDFPAWYWAHKAGRGPGRCK